MFAGVSEKLFSLWQPHGELNHDQRLRSKEDKPPSSRISIKNCSSEAVYQDFSWICENKDNNTYFGWPWLVIGDHSKMRI